MECYNISEFNGTQMPTLDSKKVAIDKKISLLQDFCILRPRHTKNEQAVRKLLESCINEHQMTRLLHDVLCGTKTLNELLKEGVS